MNATKFLLGILTYSTALSAIVNAQLRQELLQMAADDQAIRQKVIATGFTDSNIIDSMRKIDQKHTQRLQAIIQAQGWLSQALVGAEGCKAAWLLVQHSEDLTLQEQYLLLLENHAAMTEEYAYLYDRVAVRQHRKQRYGTQAQIINGHAFIYPIEDELQVDTFRAQIGLPMLAIYQQQLADMYGKPESPL
ncbi:MAG TPA: DUF6624 domain-containing protein [Candidatus Babeliales bacterium]|nr:DUF6624 domain-containing protein [Candidatus Babeliales bacterium]